MTAQQTRRRADVNVHAKALVDRLKNDPEHYRIGVGTHASGATIIDAGIAVPGGLEAGRIISEICLGGLGTVTLRAANDFARWRWHVDVHTADPVTACLGSQYAGWSLSHGKGKEGFMALGSGPARAMGSKEALFEELGYRTPSGETVMVLEVDRIPPVEIVAKVCACCGIAPSQLTCVLTPTSSLAGGVQIVARVLEVALHKVHELAFPLAAIVDGAGSAPVPPPHPDFIKAMGRTNDAILFGGQVHLYVDADDEVARALVERLPSCTSKDFGTPFAKVFKEYDYDFYRIDPMLFSPARCSVTSLRSGNTHHAGVLREDLLDQSFGA